MSAKQLFLCTGMPKSGTTFLQRILDMHPEVSCPAEHQFIVLSKSLLAALKAYDKLLVKIDHELGSPARSPFAPNLHPRLVGFALRQFIEFSAGDKPIAGANDNISIVSNFNDFNQLLGYPRFIVILRNPIDIAISNWHYNQFMAEDTGDDRHIRLVQQHGGFEGWLRYIADGFSKKARHWLSARHSNGKILIVRFEDLVLEKKASLETVFSFLGASSEESVLDEIVRHSDFDTMKAASPRKAFFRKASTSMGGEELSGRLREELAGLAPEARELGYDLVGGKIADYPRI